MVLPIEPIPARGTRINRAQSELILRTELGFLNQELTQFRIFQAYYDGNQQMVFGTDKFKEQFGPAFVDFRDNWCAPVVDATADKLVVEGILLGSGKDEQAANIELGKEIWDVFRRNDIDEQQSELHESTLIKGQGYFIAWPDDELGVRLDWNPADLIRVRYADDDPRTIIWAMKRWATPSGQVNITVYTQDEIWKYKEAARQMDLAPRSGIEAQFPANDSSLSFEPRIVPGESWPLANSFGIVPVVEYLNKSGSELTDVIPLQNGVNYLMLQALTAAGFQGFPQRVIQTQSREPVGGWSNDPGKVWHVFPDMDADGKLSYGDFHEFNTADLSGFRGLVELTLTHMALQTKTPVRMFFQSDRGGRGDAPSGESLLVEDQPLLDKVENRQRRFGNSWFRLARLVAMMHPDINNKDLPLGEMRWHDPRSKYRSALIEEGSKMVKDMGLPVKFVITQLGLSQDEIEFLELSIEEDKAEKAAEAEAAAELEAKVAKESRPVAVPPGTSPPPPRQV